MKLVVDADVMTEQANSLMGIAQNINALSDDITKALAQLQEAWQSEAADILYQRFVTLAQAFSAHHETIKAYSTFLLQAADAYRQSATEDKKPFDE